MRLLIADEECDNLIKETIKLLERLKNEKQSLPPEFNIALAKEVSVNTLIMPKREIEGTLAIMEFFEKYFNAPVPIETSGLSRKSPQDEMLGGDIVRDESATCLAVENYMKSILKEGDEDKPEDLGAARYNESKVPRPDSVQNATFKSEPQQEPMENRASSVSKSRVPTSTIYRDPIPPIASSLERDPDAALRAFELKELAEGGD